MSDLKLLTLATLPEVDASLPEDFESMLAGMVKDCLARPSIKKKRQVSILVDVAPILNQDGTCDDVEISIQVAGKSPARIIPSIIARATVKGGLKWSPDSPDNPSQETLDFDKKD